MPVQLIHNLARVFRWNIHKRVAIANIDVTHSRLGNTGNGLNELRDFLAR